MDIQNQEKQCRKVRQYTQDFKLKVVNRSRELNSVKAAAREFEIPSGTLQVWMQKYKDGGLEGLQKKSSRPNHQPKKTSQWIIDKVLALKKNNPLLGTKALSSHLTRFENVDLSAKTVSKIFKKHALPDGDQAYGEASYYVKGDDKKLAEQNLEKELGEWERFSRPNPNDLWQMDIMSFFIRDAHRVYLISALDDCSRMIVGWGLFKEQTAENVLEVLRTALAKYGAPTEILTDQGAQFKHWQGVTQFQKLLKKLGIEHIKARSHHPQTCGKIEAFHKSIHRELIDKEFFISQECAVEKIARFIEHYNYGRSHSALDGFAPADRYFKVVEAVKKYLADFKTPKNELEEKDEAFAVGRGSRLYLVGKILGQDLRIQELSGQLSIHVNNQLFKDINFGNQNLN